MCVPRSRRRRVLGDAGRATLCRRGTNASNSRPRHLGVPFGGTPGPLNDVFGFHPTADHVVRALESAQGGPVAERSVGGGTGMTCYDLGAGIGTASRDVAVDEDEHRVGVSVQATYGRRPQLGIAANTSGDPFFAATVEATEEAIVNAMGAAEPMTGVDGASDPSLPREKLRDLSRRHGRLASTGRAARESASAGIPRGRRGGRGSAEHGRCFVSDASVAR